MLELWVPWMLICNEYGSLWNRLHRLVETDSLVDRCQAYIRFNIIYIMRNAIYAHQGRRRPDFKSHRSYSPSAMALPVILIFTRFTDAAT